MCLIAAPDSSPNDKIMDMEVTGVSPGNFIASDPAGGVRPAASNHTCGVELRREDLDSLRQVDSSAKRGWLDLKLTEQTLHTGWAGIEIRDSGQVKLIIEGAGITEVT